MMIYMLVAGLMRYGHDEIGIQIIPGDGAPSYLLDAWRISMMH